MDYEKLQGVKIEHVTEKNQENATWYLNVGNVITVALDRKGNIALLNKKGCEILEYEEGELLGKNWFETCLPEDDRYRVYDDFNKLMNREIEIIKCYENTILTKNGNKKIIVWSTNLFKDNHGFITGLLISGENITEQKEAEKKLKESEKQYKYLANEFEMILDHIPGLVFYKDTNNNFIHINQNVVKYYNSDRFGKRTKLTKNDIEGKSLFDLLPKDIAQAYWDDDLEVINSGIPKLNIEESFETEQGTRWIITNKIPYVNENGKNIGIIGFSMDITEKKKAEQKLKESEEKYRLLFESSPVGIGISDFKGNVVAMNKKMNEMTGFTLEELKDIGIAATYVDQNEREKLLNELERSGQVRNYGVKLKKRDDTNYFTSLNIDVIELGGEKFFFTNQEDITERKKAEEELKKFKNISDNANYGIGMMDFDGILTYVNNYFANIHGYEPDDIIGKNFAILHNDDQLKRIIELKEKLEVDGSYHSEEVWHMHKNGSIFPTLMNGVSIKNEKGEMFLAATVIDISDQYEAKQKLRESEEKYRNVIENAKEGYYELDLKGNLTFFNNSFCEQLKFSPEELIGMNYRESADEENSKRTFEAFNRIYKTGIGQENINYELMTKNGKKVYGETSAYLRYDSNRRKIGFSGFMRDITKRKKAEQELKESEARYRHLFESSPNAIILSNKEETIIDCNFATERIFGYHKEVLIGRNYNDLGILTVDQISNIREKYKEILEGREVKPIEVQINSKNGDLIWINFQISSIMLDGEILIVYIGKVITEKRRAEELIKEENKKLLELDQMRNELITRISHELKTPLTSIFSCSELLLEYYNERIDDDILNFLEIIHRGGRRLNDLVINLLDASKMDSGKINLYKDRTDLVKSIKSSIKLVEYLAVYRNHSLNVELPEELYLEVDEIRIKQVLTNIISNAIKNTPSNGNIDVSLKSNGTYGYISIKDTGVGFTEKEMEKIFKKFGKIERYGKQLDVDIEGAGLGLYLSKEIVELHNGQIWVESEGRNKGSTFIIKLPIIKNQG